MYVPKTSQNHPQTRQVPLWSLGWAKGDLFRSLFPGGCAASCAWPPVQPFGGESDTSRPSKATVTSSAAQQAANLRCASQSPKTAESWLSTNNNWSVGKPLLLEGHTVSQDRGRSNEVVEELCDHETPSVKGQRVCIWKLEVACTN